MGSEPGEVIGIWIELLVGEQQSLFAMLAADGTINRMGSGLVDASDTVMYIGRTDPKLFEELRSTIDPSLTQFLGRSLSDPRPQGTPCSLRIGLAHADGREAVTAWRYGTDSQGPHPAVAEFVREALRITEPWLQGQKARRRLGES